MKMCTAIVNGIMFYSIHDAQAEGLIRLTKWLNVNPEEANYLAGEKERIEGDPERKALLVHDSWKIALFVNPVAEDLEEEW